MNWKREWWKMALMAWAFLMLYHLPEGFVPSAGPLGEAVHLARSYAREHVLLCLVPALFIAGAVSVFIRGGSVMRYLGPRANKVMAYGVASVCGSVLAVCSCTVLPLFAGIWRSGAGLGPATAFLYAGPAINVLAIILTARVLGMEIGVARAVGAVAFAVIVGLAMHLIYRRQELSRAGGQLAMPQEGPCRPMWQSALLLAVMVAIMVFANWAAPGVNPVGPGGQNAAAGMAQAPDDGPAAPSEISNAAAATPDIHEPPVPAAGSSGQAHLSAVWIAIWRSKWVVTGVLSAGLAIILALWFGVRWWKVVLAAAAPAALAAALPMRGTLVVVPFSAAIVGLSAAAGTTKGQASEWFAATWDFAKKILPLLLIGVLAAGFLLGRPGHEGLIPGKYIQLLVGDQPEPFLSATGMNGGLAAFVRAVWGLWTCLFASVFGAFMYFATLTEVPILQGLIGSGMGKGPALALLLAGPALSLPNMLVIASVMGARKTVVFVTLVIVMATVSGLVFGAV